MGKASESWYRRIPRALRWTAAVIVILVAAALVANSLGGDEGEATASVPPPKVSRNLTNANTDFAFRYFGVADAEHKGNVVVSPLSLSFVMQMLANGADTDNGTQEKLLRSLSVAEGVGVDEINNADKYYIEQLTAPDSGVDFKIANGIWTAPGFEPAPRVVEPVQEDYDGELARLDKSPDVAAAQINDFASDNTDGRIDHIVDANDIYPPGEQRVMFLGNALAFTGEWTKRFTKGSTGPATFHAPDGDAKVQMMRSTRKIPLLEVPGDDGFQAVRLSYGKSEQWGMYVFVPNENDGLDAMTATLSGTSWDRWRSKFRNERTMVGLPRLDMRYQRELIGDFGRLGVPLESYNSLVTKETDPGLPVQLTFARQQTFMKLDEVGTKAAAVTVVGASILAGVVTASTPVIADHPYLMVLADRKTGAIAFVAAIRDPNEHSAGL